MANTKRTYLLEGGNGYRVSVSDSIVEKLRKEFAITSARGPNQVWSDLTRPGRLTVGCLGFRF